MTSDFLAQAKALRGTDRLHFVSELVSSTLNMEPEGGARGSGKARSSARPAARSGTMGVSRCLGGGPGAGRGEMGCPELTLPHHQNRACGSCVLPKAPSTQHSEPNCTSLVREEEKMATALPSHVKILILAEVTTLLQIRTAFIPSLL